MKAVCGIMCVIFAALLLAGCTTAGRIKTPAGTALYLHGRPLPATIAADGLVKTRPFNWSATAGIKYKLEKDGAVIKEGVLPAHFRVVSIFWPPLAIIYWPQGFARGTYDLTAGAVRIYDAPTRKAPAATRAAPASATPLRNQPAVSAPMSAEQLRTKLSELKNLYIDGLITKEEYELQKQQAINATGR